MDQIDEFPGMTHTTSVEEGKIIVATTQDIEPVLRQNAALRNTDGYNDARDLKRVYDIPLALLEHWYNTEGLNLFDPNHADAIRRKLRDPEYEKLRSSFSNPNPQIIIKGVR